MNQISGFFNEFHFLSNFDEQPNVKIILDDEEYDSVEAAYQAAKTLNKEERIKIRTALTPGKAKRLGKNVTLRPDWEEIKIEVMVGLVLQKFSQSPYKEMLLTTGDAELIEDNYWGAKFWGVCNGVGENWLGIILMAMRKVLQ